MTAGGLEAAGGIPNDWSSHHVIFSTPASTADAAKQLGSVAAWLKLLASARWQFQDNLRKWRASNKGGQSTFEKRKGDWSYYLGGATGAGVSRTMFPAKYSFDINAAPDCTRDFVAFALNQDGSDGSAATATGTLTGQPSNGQTVTITNGTALILTAATTSANATGTITLSGVTAGSTVTVGNKVYTFVTSVQKANDVLIVTGRNANNRTAQNLRAALDGNSGQCYSTTCFGAGTTPNGLVTATVATNVVTVAAVTAGTGGNSIAFSRTGTGITLSNSTGYLQGGTDANGGKNFQIGANSSVTATNLAAAIARNSSTSGVSATANGTTVTLRATTPGIAGNSIRLAEGLSNFSWSATTLRGGADGQPTIVAFNSLYAGTAPTGLCGTAPRVYWAYNTGGQILTSPTLSADGTKIAFVEAGAPAVLHILKWSAGEGVSGSSYAASAPANVITSWSACPTGQSCMIDVQFSTSKDTYSSPYYDFDNDAIYVGDDNGILSKITGVFKGTPTKAFGITVNSGAALTGPVYDSVSGNIFLADSEGRLSYVREKTSTKGACASGSAPCLGTPSLDVSNNSGRPIIDPPIVDSSTGHVFVFNGGGGDPAYALATQADTALGNVRHANIGNGSLQNNVHSGTFDNAYYNNPASGHLYVCGNPDLYSYAQLYSIGFSADGTMNTTTSGGPLALGRTDSAAGQECSPLTEIYNGTTDWLFLGVTKNCGTSGASGCVMSFDITKGFPSAYHSMAAEPGGTSGIVVDGVSTQAQASSIYYTSLAAGACGTAGSGNVSTCAVKRTQDGLK